MALSEVLPPESVREIMGDAESEGKGQTEVCGGGAKERETLPYW